MYKYLLSALGLAVVIVMSIVLASTTSAKPSLGTSIARSLPLDAQQFTTAQIGAWERFRFDRPIVLKAGTAYTIVMKRSVYKWPPPGFRDWFIVGAWGACFRIWDDQGNLVDKQTWCDHWRVILAPYPAQELRWSHDVTIGAIEMILGNHWGEPQGTVWLELHVASVATPTPTATPTPRPTPTVVPPMSTPPPKPKPTATPTPWVPYPSPTATATPTPTPTPKTPTPTCWWRGCPGR